MNYFIFFFKQKTAYEMRISDWSSDVCSSDLLSGFLGVTAIFMGTVMGVVQVTIQITAGPGKLGAAAATVQFSRALGAGLGTAVVGAVLFAVLAGQDPAVAGLFVALLQGDTHRLAALPAAAPALVHEQNTSETRPAGEECVK